MIDSIYQLDAYDYDLPPDRIAQFPEAKRDQSKLMVLLPDQQRPVHRHFHDILEYLRPSDILVVNTTKVFPARLLGHKESGGKAELFLLHFPHPVTEDQADGPTSWHQATAAALIKSSKRPKVGSFLHFSDQLRARVNSIDEQGEVRVTLEYQGDDTGSLETVLSRHGQVPLPPYINRSQGSTLEDRARYQTRYARQTGSVAAPTAGLHFSDKLLQEIKAMGVEIVPVVLHVGYGTFAPVRAEDIRQHHIHREWIELSPESAGKINRAKGAGNRIWAVGTTSVRTLEFTAKEGQVHSMQGSCDLFIYPGFHFQIVDNLITNFHLPKSSLLFLVSALAGREHILSAYQEAVTNRYRFFSYGDAMAIITKD